VVAILQIRSSVNICWNSTILRQVRRSGGEKRGVISCHMAIWRGGTKGNDGAGQNVLPMWCVCDYIWDGMNKNCLFCLLYHYLNLNSPCWSSVPLHLQHTVPYIYVRYPASPTSCAWFRTVVCLQWQQSTNTFEILLLLWLLYFVVSNNCLYESFFNWNRKGFPTSANQVRDIIFVPDIPIYLLIKSGFAPGHSNDTYDKVIDSMNILNWLLLVPEHRYKTFTRISFIFVYICILLYIIESIYFIVFKII